MDNQLTSVQLELDHPNDVHRPGDILSGVVTVTVNTGQFDLDNLELRLRGVAVVKFHDELVVDGCNQYKQIKDKQEFIAPESSEIYVHYKERYIKPGKYRLPFYYELKQRIFKTLPTTFTDEWGHVRWSVELRIKSQDWQTTCSQRKIDFNFESPVTEHKQDSTVINNKVSDCQQKTVNVMCLCPTQKIKFNAYIRKAGQQLGSTVPVEYVVINKSRKTVTPRFTLRQHIIFNAQGREKRKTNDFNVVKCDDIGANASVIDRAFVEIPKNLPVLCGRCHLIAIKYTILAELDLPFDFDISFQLPIIVLN